MKKADTEPENGILLKKLTYDVNGREILHDISMEVPKGVFAGVLGANGAGKTTLLKCMIGMNRCAGEIRICGRKREDCSEKEFARLISMMNQNTNLDFSFTCRQVVEFGRFPYWGRGIWYHRDDQAAIEAAMRETGTLELSDVPVTRISGGERQRVLFAKILAQNTQVILLDEPTANMDLYYQRQLFAFGKKLAAQGKTVLAAVHDLNLALQYCERFYLLKDGRLLAQGTAEEAFRSEVMKQAYHLDTVIYQNPFFPQMELTAAERTQELQNLRIHLQYRGENVREWMYRLWSKGAALSTGPLPPDSLDAEAARIFDIPMLPPDQAEAQLAQACREGKRVVILSEASEKTPELPGVLRYTVTEAEGAAGFEAFLEAI